MGVFVDFRTPQVPATAQTNVGRSLGSLQSIASATLHAVAVRGRRLITQHWDWDETSAANPYIDPPAAGPTVHRVRFTPSPLAEFLWVGLHYQADDDVSGGSEIQVRLYTAAGAAVDGAITFDSDEGTLPQQTIDHWILDEYPILFVHTGIVEDPPTVDRPRLVMVNNTADGRGVACELRITTTNACLRGATVWEFPVQEIG